MTPGVPIPFGEGLASGLDELSGAAPLYVNLLRDSAGGLRMRPGIRAWADFGEAPVDSPVIGMFPWRTWLIFVTEDRQLWAWIAPADPNAPGANILALSDTSDADTLLDGTGRPVWTYDSMRVAVTGGGAPQQWQGVGLSARLAPGATTPSGSPMTLSYIAYLAQRFVGNDNDNTGIVQWTDPLPGNHTTWPIIGANYAEAESYPDPVVAVFSNTNEMFIFGTQTMQVFIPDPTVAFTPAASVQLGCSVAPSIIDTDGAFSWLDNRHRFVQSAGRKFEVLSTPKLANDIMQAGFVVSDGWGFRMCIGTFDLLMWLFPTEKRGFFYDRVTKQWGEFRGIDPATGAWTSWAPQSYLYWDDKNIHLVGLSDGTIGEVTFDATTDNGTAIRAISRTGFQDRGTFTRKLCRRVQMQFRRGETAQPGPAPVVELRYRDTLGNFSPVIRWSMGVAGDYQPIVDKWNAGMYKQREWELEWSGGGPFIMTGATENIEASET